MKSMLRTRSDFTKLKIDQTIFVVTRDNHVVKYFVEGIEQERRINGDCRIFLNDAKTKYIHIKEHTIYNRGVDCKCIFTDINDVKIYTLEEKIFEAEKYCKKYLKNIKIKQDRIAKLKAIIKGLKTGEL